MAQSARKGKPRTALKTRRVAVRRRAPARAKARAHAPETWWRRTGTQKSGFRYVKTDGKRLTSTAALSRIHSMVIPPAWTDVHISPDPARKIQAYGWDQRRRKQYIYSAGHVQR